MKYINSKTGAILDSPCVLSGGDWQSFEEYNENENGASSETEKKESKDDGDVVDLSNMSLSELKKLAKELGLDFGKDVKKDELIVLIAENQEVVE